MYCAFFIGFWLRLWAEIGAIWIHMWYENNMVKALGV